MKTAICYYSRHHGNTLKILEAMAEEGEVNLIDVTTRQAVRLEAYDCVGFASGIYFGKFHEGVLAFARQYLPQGKPVFSFTPTAGPRAPAQRPSQKSPTRKAARCWESLAVRATTPLAPSS